MAIDIVATSSDDSMTFNGRITVARIAYGRVEAAA